MLKFFVAGIMQGSRPEGIHGQDYRGRIKDALTAAFPGDQVFCPFENHPESVGYGDTRASRVFLDLVREAGESDVVVAYVPEASMGTAIEMWSAFENGRVVVAISDMAKNWVIRFCSHHVCEDLGEFEAFVGSGGLARLIGEQGGPT